MASSRLLARLLAQGVVVLGAAIAVFAWRAHLPANALLGAVCALAAALWMATRDREPERFEAAPADGGALRLAQERERRTLQAFLDQAPTPLVTLQGFAELTAVNRAARRLFHTDGVVDDAALLAAVEAASPDGRHTVRLAAGGLPRVYALSVADVAGAGGSLRLAALTDIQAELQAAEAAALKELLQVLSHEIMNSLTPLASLAQSAGELLDERTDEGRRLARDSIAVIARRTDGLHRFVDAYRELARLPPPSPRPTSLATLLTDAAHLFETRWGPRGVALRLEPPSPDVMIRLDPDLTAQALLGVLSNAAEAALAGGAKRPQVRLSARPAGDGAAIMVEDNGPGLDGADPAEIFRPFFTTKAEGSGIGLSLARQAIVSQGGQLVLARSAPGEGCAFTLEL